MVQNQVTPVVPAESNLDQPARGQPSQVGH